jgi:site-specific recombinase XerD
MENEKSKVQKRTFTAVEQACHEINGFREFYEQIEEKMVLSGQTRSTLSNYIRKLAHLSLKFGKLPQQIPEKDINGYLASLARGSKSPSLSIFKHTIYGLRYCYHMLGMNEKAIKLPSLKHDHKLPVVLNYQECIAIFKAPELLKHRVLLALIYSAGLRAQEASQLKIGDLDFERMMIHIRQSKYKKDRYVPLSPLMLGGLHKYISACGPVEYVFNGHKVGTPMSIGGIQWVFREAVKKCNIQKRVTLHTLRHSYATHLLEFGMDILTIKELLGHQRITTTMIYLHVAKPRRTNLFSPFDRLYDKL